MDIGRPEKYLEAVYWTLDRREENVVSANNEKMNPMHPSSIDKTVEVDPTATIEGPTILGDGCCIERDAIVKGYSVIGKNVTVAERTQIVNSVVYQGSSIGRCSLVDRSIVDEECKIGMSIYHHK